MNQDIIDEAEKEFIKLLNGKALPTKQLTEVAEHYFIVGYEIATEKLSISSQTEISDEEIIKGAEEWYEIEGAYKPSMIAIKTWLNACKWYREQLKQKI